MARYKPGTMSNFSGSMAQIMETEFESIWRSRHDEPLSDESREERRMLFVAVARGVMQHLQQHAYDGLVVTYDTGYQTGVRATVTINVE